MDRPRPSDPPRLGLFGGSFDPIHEGHLHAARVAQEAFGLARVVFVPASLPPHKLDRTLAPGSHRLAMVELAIAEEATWMASDLELRREGPSFTIDTVRTLAAEVGEAEDSEIHLILGTDNLPGLPSWKEVGALLGEARPVVVLRDDDPPGLDPSIRAGLDPATVQRLESGFVRAPSRRGRATDLREALRTGKGDLSDLPDAVGRYVLEHGLYGVCRWG